MRGEKVEGQVMTRSAEQGSAVAGEATLYMKGGAKVGTSEAVNAEHRMSARCSDQTRGGGEMGGGRGGDRADCSIRRARRSRIHDTAGSIVSSLPTSKSRYTVNGISSLAPSSTNTDREQSRTKPPCMPVTVRHPSNSLMGWSQRGITQSANANAQRSNNACSDSKDDTRGAVAVRGREG